MKRGGELRRSDGEDGEAVEEVLTLLRIGSENGVGLCDVACE